MKAENKNEIRTYSKGAFFCYTAQCDDFGSQDIPVPNFFQEEIASTNIISEKYKNYNQ